MRLIDGDALYEKACDLEAQALDYTVKISSDEEKRDEWLKWSAILAERTAFKHDVYDAPTIEPERKTGKWIERDSNGVWQCDQCRKYCLIYKAHYCPNCGARMGEEDE